MAELERDMEMR